MCNKAFPRYRNQRGWSALILQSPTIKGCILVILALMMCSCSQHNDRDRFGVIPAIGSQAKYRVKYVTFKPQGKDGRGEWVSLRAVYSLRCVSSSDSLVKYDISLLAPDKKQYQMVLSVRYDGIQGPNTCSLVAAQGKALRRYSDFHGVPIPFYDLVPRFSESGSKRSDLGAGRYMAYHRLREHPTQVSVDLYERSVLTRSELQIWYPGEWMFRMSNCLSEKYSSYKAERL